MIYPGAKRLRLCIAIGAVAAFAAIVPAVASANITPTVSTVYGSTVPGAHSDYTITQNYDYGAAATTEDMQKWVVDSPAGLAGNPNAIPAASRCTDAQFNGNATGPAIAITPGLCPAASQVGVASITTNLDAADGAFPAGFSLGATAGKIYLTSTSPEVPTTLSTIFGPLTDSQGLICGSANCQYYIRTASVLQPVTSGADGDFRIRTIPTADSPAPFADPPSPPFSAGIHQTHITQIVQHLFAYANNDTTTAPFLTNPTRCDAWNSYAYVTSAVQTNADSNPDPAHPNAYKKSNTDTVIPNCTSKPSYNPIITTSLTTLKRDANPGLTVTISNPNAPGVDLPKTVVTTLPASITTDLQGIGNLCEPADAAAGNCPAASQRGTVTIQTPFISAGLSGAVYIVRGSSSVLPDLSVKVTGAINFILSAQDKFVGPAGNQIQTTFDNLPQTPFTKFTLNIAGYKDSLLTTSVCPGGSASPGDGPITYSTTSWGGLGSASTYTPALVDCFGVAKIKKITKCVKSSLKVSPAYKSRSEVQKAQLYVKAGKKYKMVKTLKKSPFRFSVKLSSKTFKKGSHLFKVRTVYDRTPANPKNKVISQFSRLKKC